MSYTPEFLLRAEIAHAGNISNKTEFDLGLCRTTAHQEKKGEELLQLALIRL